MIAACKRARYSLRGPQPPETGSKALESIFVGPQLYIARLHSAANLLAQALPLARGILLIDQGLMAVKFKRVSEAEKMLRITLRHAVRHFDQRAELPSDGFAAHRAEKPVHHAAEVAIGARLVR